MDKRKLLHHDHDECEACELMLRQQTVATDCMREQAEEIARLSRVRAALLEAVENAVNAQDIGIPVFESLALAEKARAAIALATS